MHLWLDILLSALGVAAAPFIIQGIRKSRSRTAKVMQALFGVGLAIFFLAIWGQFGRDPLQLTYCWALPNAPSCPPPSPETRIGGTWRLVGSEHPCDRWVTRTENLVTVEVDGVRFTERIERVDDDAVVVVVTAPDVVAGQRFRLAPSRNGDRLNVAPLLGGQPEEWVRCSG